MSHFLFILLLFVAAIIRLPLSVIVVILRPLVPFIKKRLNFERKNFIEEECRSFRRDNLLADYCFLVSSEGELEQVRPLIEATLATHKKIEIVYSSPSVESKCQSIYKGYPEQIRLFRLPLMSASPFNILYFQSIWEWVSAPVVVFCRYDFFPELLSLKFFKKKFILVSGAFKKMTWYKLQSFKFFDVVVAATDHEKENFTKVLPDKKIFSCDFRVPRIHERMKNAQNVLAKKESIKKYLDHIANLPVNEKIIFGSAWKSDMEIFNDESFKSAVKSGKLHLLLAPHKLDDAFSLELKDALSGYFGSENVGIVNDKTPYKGESVVILQMGGILCELYSLFSLAYVGGGYERSIHSVLEPFISNNAVITGPKVSRSTEIDLASLIAPHEIHVLNRPESFYTIKESIDLAHLDLSAREKFRQDSEREMKAVLIEL